MKFSVPIRGNTGSTDRNRKKLEMLAGFSHEQGLTPRRMRLDELFLRCSRDASAATSTGFENNKKYYDSVGPRQPEVFSVGG